MKKNGLRKIYRNNKKLVITFILLIILPILSYLGISILYYKWVFNLNILIALYYGIFSVVLGSFVFISVKELKISNNNEEFMDILNEIINEAEKEIVIICPNANIGQTILPDKFKEYHLNIKKKIEAKKNKPNIVFYCKNYDELHYEKIEGIKTKDEFIKKEYSKNTMVEFIQASFAKCDDINDKNIQDYLKDLKHFLIDLNGCSFKNLEDKIWESNIFAAYNENILFFGIYHDINIRGEKFYSKPAINSIKILLGLTT